MPRGIPDVCVSGGLRRRVVQHGAAAADETLACMRLRVDGCIRARSSGSIGRCPLVRRAHGRSDRRRDIRRHPVA